MTQAASAATPIPAANPPTELSLSKDGVRRMANAIRALAMDAVEAAKSGHPGMPRGMADVATVLFTRFLKFDSSDPAWPELRLWVHLRQDILRTSAVFIPFQ